MTWSVQWALGVAFFCPPHWELSVMLYRSYTPTRQLDNFVDGFWFYQDAPPHFKERILPSGTMELVINLCDDELRIYDPVEPERCKRFSGAIVSGPYGGSFVIDARQQASIMGVHFKPGGTFPFLGASADELADRHVDLESLWGPSAAKLCEAVTPEERVSLMEEALAAHLFRPLEHRSAVSFALGAFARAGQGAMVRDIARRAGLSQRRFIQVFSAEVGMTPKLFYRVRRFQRVLALVRQSIVPDWARLAAACGYFDQSHLIHDFLAFSGLNPTDYFRQRSERVKENHVPLA